MGILAIIGNIIGAGGRPSYVANYSNYDGDTYWALRSTDFVSPFADSKQFTLSFWIDVDADNSDYSIAYGAGAGYAIQKETANRFSIFAENAAGTAVLTLRSGNDKILAANGKQHVFCSVDMDVAGSGSVYVDGVKTYSEFLLTAGETLNFTTGTHGFGSTNTGSQKLNGCLSELYFNTDEYLDGDAVGVIEKFRSAAGAPVSLGANGSVPTGNQPTIYIPDGDSEDNKGYGGNYTAQAGALSACPDITSDYARWEFDAQPAAGANIAVDTHGIFRAITMANAADYTTKAGWIGGSAAAKVAASDGCGASVAVNTQEQEFLRLDTLTSGALLHHVWIDVPAGALVDNAMFTYGEASGSPQEDYGTFMTGSKLPFFTFESNTGAVTAVTTGVHSIFTIFDTANEIVTLWIDGVEKASTAITNFTGLPAVNNMGWFCRHGSNFATSDKKMFEGDTGNFYLKDMLMIRVESDQSSLFPELISDMADATPGTIPASFNVL